MHEIIQIIIQLVTVILGMICIIGGFNINNDYVIDPSQIGFKYVVGAIYIVGGILAIASAGMGCK